MPDASPFISQDKLPIKDLSIASLVSLSSVAYCLELVRSVHAQRLADPVLHHAFLSIKRIQCHRFRCTYRDILQPGDMQPPADFFLTELYGDHDFSRRDAQFARITDSLERLFPASVHSVTLALVKLHAVSEQLDLAMARSLIHTPHFSKSQLINTQTYITAWQTVGHQSAREEQLRLVDQLGSGLAKLTQTPGLRTMLKMMRKPALVAGLSELQGFLESGFDTFSQLQRSATGVTKFLSLIQTREGLWIDRLYKTKLTGSADPVLWPELEFFKN
jgi:hypothetical protein